MNRSGSPGSAEFGSTDRRNATEPRTDFESSAKSAKLPAFPCLGTPGSEALHTFVFSNAAGRVARRYSSLRTCARAPDLRRASSARSARCSALDWRDVVWGGFLAPSPTPSRAPGTRADHWHWDGHPDARVVRLLLREGRRATGNALQDGFARLELYASMSPARRPGALFPSGSSEDASSSPGSRSRPAIWSAPRRNASVSVFVFLLHLTAVAVSSGASAKGRSWVNANAPATTSTARPARTSTDTEAALVTPGRETRKTYAPSSEKDACGKGARQRRIERPKWSAAWIRRCGVVRAQRASESVRE